MQGEVAGSVTYELLPVVMLVGSQGPLNEPTASTCESVLAVWSSVKVKAPVGSCQNETKREKS